MSERIPTRSHPLDPRRFRWGQPIQSGDGPVARVESGGARGVVSETNHLRVYRGRVLLSLAAVEANSVLAETTSTLVGPELEGLVVDVAEGYARLYVDAEVEDGGIAVSVGGVLSNTTANSTGRAQHTLHVDVEAGSDIPVIVYLRARSGETAYLHSIAISEPPRYVTGTGLAAEYYSGAGDPVVIPWLPSMGSMHNVKIYRTAVDEVTIEPIDSESPAFVVGWTSSDDMVLMPITTAIAVDITDTDAINGAVDSEASALYGLRVVAKAGGVAVAGILHQASATFDHDDLGDIDSDYVVMSRPVAPVANRATQTDGSAADIHDFCQLDGKGFYLGSYADRLYLTDTTTAPSSPQVQDVSNWVLPCRSVTILTDGINTSASSDYQVFSDSGATNRVDSPLVAMDNASGKHSQQTARFEVLGETPATLCWARWTTTPSTGARNAVCSWEML